MKPYLTAVIGRRPTEPWLLEARATRAEQRLVRKLGLQLIRIGYQALEAPIHPYQPGGAEAMAHLNTVRDRLKRALPATRLHR